MSNEIKLEGLEELLAKLSMMKDNVNKYENKALHAGADMVEQSQKDIVRREAYDKGKLHDGLKKGKISTKKGVKTIPIGIQKDDNTELFYGKFINWGYVRRDMSKKGLKSTRNKREVTKVVPGIHFMERSIEENKTTVIDTMKTTIKAAIKDAKR